LLLKIIHVGIGFKYLYAFVLKKYKDKGTIFERNKKMTGGSCAMNIAEMVLPTVRQVPPSGIRKFFDLVNEMKDAISLSIGEPDFVTPWNIGRPVFIRWKKGIPTIRQMRDYGAA